MATIIHVDIDPTSVSKNVEADIPVVGTCTSVLKEILSLIEQSDISPDTDAISNWWQQIDEWRAKHGLYTASRYEESSGETIKPQDVIKMLYKITGGKAIITSDVGQHQMFVAQYYHFNKPRRWINSGGLGTMGFGLPAAMGAKLAFPKDEVVCVTGEGSIQMCIQELSTCLQYNLPIKIININNEALGMVRQWQDMNYGGRHSASTYADSLPDFVKLAESYGHVGMKVTKQSQLRKTLDKAFASTTDVKTFGNDNTLKITTSYLIDEKSDETDAKVESVLKEGLVSLNAGNAEVVSSQKVGPTIANDIKTKSVYAVIFSIIIIALYIFIRFRKWQYSIAALVALTHDVLLVLSFFSLFNGYIPFSLDIDQAFIAAILTVVGYSVTDTVVVFDRIREFLNLHHAKTDKMDEVINDAINSTLSRTIITALTVLFVLLVLFIFGGAVIRGFSFALLVGVIFGTYSSICVASPVIVEFNKKNINKS